MNSLFSMAALRRVAVGLAALPLAGCGFVVIHGARYVYGEHQKQTLDVNAALARYQQHVLLGETADTAAMFDVQAELSIGEHLPVVGRPAILDRLKLLAADTVVDYELTATDTSLIRDGAIQTGTYRQRVKTPQGEVVADHGVFEARWSHEPGSRWLITRLHTAPQAGT